jgi:hypothetical protein
LNLGHGREVVGQRSAAWWKTLANASIAWKVSNIDTMHIISGNILPSGLFFQDLG